MIRGTVGTGTSCFIWNDTESHHAVRAPAVAPEVAVRRRAGAAPPQNGFATMSHTTNDTITNPAARSAR